MSDFSASIIARLDTTKIPSDIKEIEKKKILLSNFSLDTRKLPSQIQTSLDGHKFKINIDGIKVGDIDSQFKKIGSSANKSFSQSFTVYKDLMDIQRRLGSMNLQFAKLDPSKNVAEYKELQNQMDRLNEAYSELNISNGKNLSDAQIRNLSNAFDIANDKLNILQAKLKDTSSSKQLSSDFGDLYNIAKKISTLRISIAGLDQKADANQISELNKQLRDLIQAYSGLVQQMSGKLPTEQFEKLKTVHKEMADSLAILRAKSKDGIKYASALDVNTFDNKLTEWLQKNSAAAKEFSGAIEAIRNKLHTLNSAGQLTDDALKDLYKDLEAVNQQAIKEGKIGRTLTDTFSRDFKSILNYVSVSSVIYSSVSGLKEMCRNVVEIDSAMTELKKVTNETSEAYANFLSGASKSAKDIGSTVTDYINSTSYFARLGYSFGDSQELAKVANIYAVVGDEIKNNEDATKSIISTLTAFDVEADNAISIVDKFNEIGNRFSISSGGIGSALEKSASSLAAANNSLDQSIALITAANTVVQDPEAVGTAFKTIAMRIRGAETELIEAGLDAENMAESTAKLREEILALSGVDIMIDDNNFKSTYQILDELAAKWEHLTDIQQASVTELIAGKRQGNIVSSLMSNFDIAREALTVSSESAGSAMAEHEKWMESLQAKLNQLQAAWQGLSQAFMDDSALKLLIDSGTVLISVLTSIVDKVGSFNLVLAGVGLAAFIKNFDWLNRAMTYPEYVLVYYGERTVIMATAIIP